MNDTRSKLFSPPKPSSSDLKMSKQIGVEVVQQEHIEVQDYVDKVHPKTLLAIELEEQRLNQRYSHLLNQLDRTRQQVQKLEEKLKSQNDLENHPQIKEIVDELAKVDKYKMALINKTQQLKDALSYNKFTIRELKQQVYSKRLQIRSIVQESWRYQTEILHFNEIAKDAQQIPLSKSKHKSKSGNMQSLDIKEEANMFLTVPDQQHKKYQFSTLPPIPLKSKSKSMLFHVVQNVSTQNQHQQIGEILDIYKQVQELRKRAQKSKAEILKISNRFSQVRNLLNECLFSTVKHFKNRQKITNSNGYANSIYFDVSTINVSTIKNNESQIGGKERKIQNILYDTLQHIMIDMIDSQQRNDSNGSTIADSIIRNQVSLEQFMQFSSDQILGLLVLQPRLLQELVSVFDIKQKQIGLLGGKLRLYSNQLEQ